jgi:hypothetical protein
VQGGADADGAVLLPRDVGEPAHRLDVVDRRQSETLRPLRERAGGEAHAGVLDERVPRIGADGDGTPCGVCAARAWRLLFQTAACRAERMACTLKCDRCLPRTTVVVGDFEIARRLQQLALLPTSMTVWNISPHFSSRLMRATRSAARSSALRRGSSYGSITPLPLRSRKRVPSGAVYVGVMILLSGSRP